MKVLILQNKLLHYRIPLYNAISRYEGIQLTVAHPDKEAPEEGLQFTQVILQTRKKGPFTLHHGLYNFCCEFDVVIAMFDIKWLTHMKLSLIRNRPFKLIYWGIGVSTERGFDVDHRFDRLRYFFARRADALLFYSDYPIRKYVVAGFDPKTLFVAHNTVYAESKSPSLQPKRSFLFIGSLERRKKIYELLDAFKGALNSRLKGLDFTLDVIGGGPEKELIQHYIEDHGLTNNVVLRGLITKEEDLWPYFEKAIACISPGQAGLSVLNSFAMGVPFITRYDAITGGERLNIIDGNNGLIYSGNDLELTEIITKLALEPSFSLAMGANARAYYFERRSIEQMADGFYKAICFSENKGE